MPGGEVQVRGRVGLRVLEQRARGGGQRAGRVDRRAVRRPRGGGARLAEGRLHRLGRHRPMALGGQRGAGVALGVDDATPPAGARQALLDRADEAGVGVAVGRELP